MKRFRKKGQSILEYTLLLGVIIAAIVTVLLGSGGFQDQVEDSYDKAGDVIDNSTSNLSEGIFE